MADDSFLATLRDLHDRLGSMIDQVGHPDYSLRELVNGLRDVRDELMRLSSAVARTSPSGLWMVYFEDAEMHPKPEIFFGEGAEVAARKRYAQAKDQWSCHLLSRVPDSAAFTAAGDESRHVVSSTAAVASQRGDFRKKPVVIHAVRWTGDNLREIIDFTGLHPSASKWTWEQYEDVVRREGLKIFTLEGPLMAAVGDWIIEGVHGEHYPCKPDIFEQTYEPAHIAPSSKEPLTDSFVQTVPDKCDRIVWRNRYYHLPIAQSATARTSGLGRCEKHGGYGFTSDCDVCSSSTGRNDGAM